MKNLIKYSVLGVAFATALAITSFGGKKADDSKEVAEDQNAAKLDNAADLKKDYDFAVEAADGGMFEVKLGELALRQGSSDRVREFGQMMATDHTKANAELMALAATKNISIPSSLSDKCQKKYDDLAKKSGNDFDKAYTSLMVDDHKEDIDAFKSEGEKGNDPELKAWAYNKVPTLEHHLEMAKQAKDAVHK